MAVSYTDVEVELGKFLKAIPGVTNIAWPNIPFTPPTNQLWVRNTLLTTIPDTVFYGTEPKWDNGGVYKVTVFGPIGQGLAPVSRLVDQIISEFRSVGNITANEINIRIENAWRSTALSDNQYFQMSANVSVNFIN